MEMSCTKTIQISDNFVSRHISHIIHIFITNVPVGLGRFEEKKRFSRA